MIETNTLLLVMSGLIVSLCGLPIIVNAAGNGYDPVGRMWSVSFTAAFVVAVGYGAALEPRIWWGISAGNTAAVFAVGAVWSGCRMFNERKSVWWVPAALAAFTLTVSLAAGPNGGEWAGAIPLWPVISLLAALSAGETARGRLHRNLNGQVLGVTLWIVAVFFLARAIIFLLEGPAGVIFTQYFSTGVSSGVTIIMVISGTMAVVSLRAESSGLAALDGLGRGFHSSAGVLSADTFAQSAVDHIERAFQAKTGLALIVADLDNLSALNRVFGRGAGDEAIRRFAGTLRRTVPVLSVIGYRSPGSFLVLVRADSAAEAQRLGVRIQTAMVDDPLAELHHIRLTASVGTAITSRHGHDLAALTDAADAAMTLTRNADSVPL